MTLKLIPGFKSLCTHHCITGSMRHIYDFHNHPISEEMLLGLGAGLGFIYWHMKGTMPFLGGQGQRWSARRGGPGDHRRAAHRRPR